MKRLLPTLTIILVSGMLTVSTPTLAQDACEGQIGAAHGLCTAAGHLSCGTESEKNTEACIKIEDNFVKIAGEVPPWLGPRVAACADLLPPEEIDYFLCDSSTICPSDCSTRANSPGGQSTTCACYTK